MGLVMGEVTASKPERFLYGALKGENSIQLLTSQGYLSFINSLCKKKKN